MSPLSLEIPPSRRPSSLPPSRPLLPTDSPSIRYGGKAKRHLAYLGPYSNASGRWSAQCGRSHVFSILLLENPRVHYNEPLCLSKSVGPALSVHRDPWQEEVICEQALHTPSPAKPGAGHRQPIQLGQACPLRSRLTQLIHTKETLQPHMRLVLSGIEQ